MRFFWNGLLAVCLAGLLSCASAGKNTALMATAPLNQREGAGPAAVPGPQQIARQLSFDDSAQYRFGAEFDEGAPHQRVERQGSSAQYWPEGPGFPGMAFAVYSFSLSGYDEEAELHFDWSQLPNASSLAVALADWDAGRWDWFSPADSSLLQLLDLSPYIRADGACLVCIALSGVQPATLDKFSFGNVSAPVPVAVVSVAPHGGEQGVPVRFAAVLKGDGPYSYSWDLGGAATPNTSTDSNPLVTLGPPGSYSANLTVSNRFSSDNLSFIIKVIEQGNWTHTLGFPEVQNVVGADVDSLGNVYLVFQSFSHTSGQWGPHLAKFAPDGTLLWTKLLLSATSTVANGLVVASNDDLLVALYNNYDDWEHLSQGTVLLRFSPEGESLTSATCTLTGPVSFAADGAALISYDGQASSKQRLQYVPADWSAGWIAELSDPAAAYFSLSPSCTCFGADGSIYLSCHADYPMGHEDGLLLLHLNTAGTVDWTRAAFGPESSKLQIRGLGASPDGVIAVASVDPNSYAPDANREDHVVAFSSTGELQFIVHRDCTAYYQKPLCLGGTIYIAGYQLMRDAQGAVQYGALSAYDLNGQQLGSWRPVAQADGAWLAGLEICTDSSLLGFGQGSNAYVSLETSSHTALNGAVPTYAAATIECTVTAAGHSAFEVNMMDASPVLDSGSGGPDALIMKFDLDSL